MPRVKQERSQDLLKTDPTNIHISNTISMREEYSILFNKCEH